MVALQHRCAGSTEMRPGAEAAGAERFRMQSTLEMRWRAGAVWFYWAALFAVAAAVLRSSGQTWASFLDLGVLHAPFLTHVVGGNTVAALAVAVTVLVFLGWFAGLGKTWAFVVGILAYAVDGALLAMQGQWFAVVVHALILIFIYGGATAAGMAKENERLARELVIRAALAKDKATQPPIPDEPVKPTSADPLDAPQPFRPGLSSPADEE
jgi:hypothetical protein